MVFVALEHADGSVQMGFSPIRIPGESFFSKTHTMAFDVGFVQEVDAVPVTKVIPSRLIGIMTAADGVDIKLLHHLNVFLHYFGGDGLAAIRVKLVPIDSFDQD